MASTVTVQNLMDRMRRAADIESATSRFPDAEIQDYLKTAHREWTDFLLNNGVTGWLESTATVNTVASTATVSLPSDYYRLLGVSVDIGGTDVPLSPLPIGERHMFGPNQGGWISSRRLYYRVSGSSTLTLYPTPDGVYTVTIYYVPEAEVDFTTTSNTVDGYNGWDEYIVLTAAIMAMDKDNRSNSHLITRKSKLEASIKSSIKSLSVGEPPRITNVSNRYPRYRYW